MHFSIPDSTENTDIKIKGTPYTVYNIQINGFYHCSLRFSQLHDFNAKLKKEFPTIAFPSFPSKKILSLSPYQIEDRRLDLEKYIQQISQYQQVVSSDTFNNFFLKAQQDSLKEVDDDVYLDVFLPNGHQVKVVIRSTDNTDSVFENVASKINLNDKFIEYFGLFLITKDNMDKLTVVRRLQSFESPYISLKSINKNVQHWIFVRKSYWDNEYDNELIEDRIAMNLLYLQAVCDLENEWIEANKNQLERLQQLAKNGSKKEYLKYIQVLRFYNFLIFKPCYSDHPSPFTKIILSVGNKEINFKLMKLEDIQKELEFKITRIRCWRIASLSNDIQSNKEMDLSNDYLELSFEYLISKNSLKWITIYTKQAILLSMCLQSIVEELLLKKDGLKINQNYHNRKSTKDSSTILFSNNTNQNTNSISCKENVYQSQRNVCDISSLNNIGKNMNVSTVKSSLFSLGVSRNNAFDGLRDDGIKDDDL